MGVERTTYIIDPKGKIVRVFDKVKVPGHVDAVIAAVQELQGAA
jgi:peroxiredoxin Q/BCP